MTSPSSLADPDLRPAPEPIAVLAMAREQSLSRLLVTYIVTGLAFMAVTEMAAVTLFALSMVASFAQPAPPTACALDRTR